MLTIDQYLDLARDRLQLASDHQLSKTLGVRRAAVSCYRTKRNWPDDATMLKIAELAGIDPRQALLDLNAWRTVEPARSVYARIAAKIGQGVSVLALIFSAHAHAASSQNAPGTNQPERSARCMLCD